MYRYIKIFLCFGESKVCYGVVFFKDKEVKSVIYDKLLAENVLKLIPNKISFAFISTVCTATARLKNIKLDYFDGYMHNYSNGIVRYDKSKMHSKIDEKDYRSFANVMFGKVNAIETLIEM